MCGPKNDMIPKISDFDVSKLKRSSRHTPEWAKSSIWLLK